jgi:hypothetical protein
MLHAKGEKIAETMKFIYVTIIFLSMFLIANGTNWAECLRKPFSFILFKFL